jgi:hypothetical protein
MDFITANDTRLKAYLWAVTEFCLTHKSDKCAIRHMDRDQLFRFVAFCHLDQRLYSCFEDNQCKAVAFMWADWEEHIEAKNEYGKLQFEWVKQHRGDCAMVGDVIGTAKYVKRLWISVTAHNPALLDCPIYTMRRGKLVRLSINTVERLCRRVYA